MTTRRQLIHRVGALGGILAAYSVMREVGLLGPDTAQAGIVDPGAAAFLELVERFMDQKDRSQQGGRFRVVAHRHEQAVLGLPVHVGFIDPARMKADAVIVPGRPDRASGLRRAGLAGLSRGEAQPD